MDIQDLNSGKLKCDHTSYFLQVFYCMTVFLIITLRFKRLAVFVIRLEWKLEKYIRLDLPWVITRSLMCILYHKEHKIIYI